MLKLTYHWHFFFVSLFPTLSALLICENTLGSSSLVSGAFTFCVEGTISFVYLEGNKIVISQDVTGWATSFVWATEGN